ncbi:MAG TPA: hypothetical protein VN761_07785, partial [Candidatus Polarisedimenticolia bacterium]|nr:hypothetical protein [Candidatus Polarisedimenticolia bacterium]
MAVSGGASRRSQRGVALVVTLIMLAIITFMAVTFLVLSQRERSAVNGSTDSKIARNASDTAMARVCTELLTRMMLQSNFQDFSLIVSTNYINQAGLHGGVTTPLSPTNVNYDYLDVPGHPAISSAQDRNIAIASLEFNPRAPVFVVTNTGTGQGEFRYYYDMNRNGRDDLNGNWPVLVADRALGLAYLTTNSAGQVVTVATNAGGWIITNTMVGDPDWIGILEHPQELHSADNRFIARYAYYVVPIGKALDVNTIYNESLSQNVLQTGNDGYLRNQGVGPWEINLAAFLADLNTNIWCPVANLNVPNRYYNYNEGFGPDNNYNTGTNFDDARAILSYRYAGQYNNTFLTNAAGHFPAVAAALRTDGIDEYSDGPRMLTTTTNEAGVQEDNPLLPWPGSDNRNHFFSPQDFFDPNKTSTGFVERLQRAGTSNDTYNAYTYYRLLAQLGGESAADQGKININYKNTDDSGNVIPGLETNLNSWTALDFFTNAANAMFRQMDLRDFQNQLVTITNIPIYEDPLKYTNINYYTPAVHRVLQLAANMFDAMTNHTIGTGPTNYPTVFRPIFNSQGGIVSIVGYQEVTNDIPALSFQYRDASDVAANPGQYAGINIYGVPWVIGAKKGFPNFNEFTMDNPLTVSRDLEFTNSAARPPWTTNQIFNLSITNTFGLEAWNSYTNAYGRALELVASNQLTIIITNEFNTSLLQVTNLAFGTITNWNTGWPAWRQDVSDNSFMVPLFVSNNYTNGIYERNGTFVPLNPPSWDATFRPHLWMSLQFKLQYILIDTSVNPHRVVDFVNLITTQPTVDIPAMLDNTANGFEVATHPDAPWDTNFLNRGTANGPLKGVYTQMQIGSGVVAVPDYVDTTGQSTVFYDRIFN